MSLLQNRLPFGRRLPNGMRHPIEVFSPTANGQKVEIHYQLQPLDRGKINPKRNRIRYCTALKTKQLNRSHLPFLTTYL